MLHVVLLFFVCICLSCNKDESSSDSNLSEHKASEASSFVLGQKLNNPYRLRTMQAAFDSIRKESPSLVGAHSRPSANCYYVKFLLSDSNDVHILQDIGVEYYNYPLDYEILSYGDGSDVSLSGSVLGSWVYTCVGTNFDFPSVQHTIIDTCYVPQYDSNLLDDKHEEYIFALESKAIYLSDLPVAYHPHIGGSKAFQKPHGTVRTTNDQNSSYIMEPLKGVKVRCNYFVHISYTYTSSTGYYQLHDKFLCRPYYQVVFKNTKGFTIWGNRNIVAPACKELGQNSNTGKSYDFPLSDNSWRYTAANNAGYEYYNMCSSSGIMLPPQNLKMLFLTVAQNSSAAMMRRVVRSYSNIDFGSFFYSFLSYSDSAGFSSAVGSSILSGALYLISLALPDITIGVKGKEHSYYYKIYMQAWHELTHASHYAKVGSDLWKEYIMHIINSSLVNFNYLYGDGTLGTTRESICGLGESWAYANEDIKAVEMGRSRRRQCAYYWFYSSWCSIYDLVTNNILTGYEIYNCLTSDITSIDALKNKLLTTYPDRCNEISYAFDHPTIPTGN